MRVHGSRAPWQDYDHDAIEADRALQRGGIVLTQDVWWTDRGGATHSTGWSGP